MADDLKKVDQMTKRFDKDGTTKEELDVALKGIKGEFKAIKSITIIDGEEDWDFDYVASPGQKKDGPKKSAAGQDLKKAKSYFKRGLFSRQELQDHLGVSKTTAVDRINQWKQDGVIFENSSLTFDTETKYSFDEAKGGRRETSEGNRARYGYTNPPGAHPIVLEILSKGLRKDSPKPKRRRVPTTTRNRPGTTANARAPATRTLVGRTRLSGTSTMPPPTGTRPGTSKRRSRTEPGTGILTTTGDRNTRRNRRLQARRRRGIGNRAGRRRAMRAGRTRIDPRRSFLTRRVTPPGPTLTQQHEAYEEWVGKPLDIMTLARTRAIDGVPREMHLLFFGPALEDALPGDERFTLIATAGMSACPMRGSVERIELVLRIQGTYSEGPHRAIAQSLAEFAVLPYRLGTYLTSNLVFRGVGQPLFEGMDCVLVTNVGVHTPVWLPRIRPPVRLLWIKPIYASEADVIEQIGDMETARRFARLGVNWDDPHREPAMLEFAFGDAPHAEEGDRSDG